MAYSIEQLIETAYTAFNKRDIPTALSVMHADVNWPNGWEGGYVKGHKAVSHYWTRQWQQLDPQVIPVLVTISRNKADVTVQQIVKDKSGNLLSDSIVMHSYIFEDGLIRSMEILSPEGK